MPAPCLSTSWFLVSDSRLPLSGREIPDARSVECIDLVVNPTVGMDVVDDCQALGIWNLFIQPGAGSKELIDKARGKDMSVHEGCILLELPAPSL